MNDSRPSSRELYFRLLSCVRPHARPFALALLGMVLAAATEPLFPALMQPLLDGGFAREGQAPAFAPIVFAAAIVGIFVLRGLITFLSHYAMQWVAHRVVMDLRDAMFARMVQLPARFYDDATSGALLSKVTYDVTGVTSAATTVVTVLVRDTLTVAGLLAWMLWLDWQLTLIALAAGPLVVLVVRALSQRLRDMARHTQRTMGEMTHVLEESIDCHRVVKVFGGQAHESRRFRGASARMRGYTMREVIAAALVVPVTHVLAAVALAVIVYMALAQSASSGTSVGAFASFITAMLMLLSPLKRLTEVNAPLQRGLAAAESVFALLDAEPEDDRGTVVLGRARGAIRYEGVCFTYATRAAPALEGIDLEVAPGETVALVGGSGGGKTTLVHLLPRFYSPQAGRITLDGHDLQALTLESLRANLALVSQDVVLFNDTVRANIAYGRMAAADDATVIAAAEAAHAWAFIRAMPQGLDTLIGENGLRLSGGQRQRLAIARALLKDAPVLILDEATSALDTGSERQVQAALDVLMKDRTTIVIAHRLSTIERADRILVLEGGRIIEAGRHEVLLARGGAYARLHRLQFGEAAA